MLHHTLHSLTKNARQIFAESFGALNLERHGVFTIFNPHIEPQHREVTNRNSDTTFGICLCRVNDNMAIAQAHFVIASKIFVSGYLTLT